MEKNLQVLTPELHRVVRVMKVYLSVTILMLLAHIACGCQQQGAGNLTEEETGLLKIAQAYRHFTAMKRRPPSNENELKQFLKEYRTKEMLEILDEEDTDSYFVSPHDGQPYVILYNRQPGDPKQKPPPVIAYERSGKDGRRLVAAFYPTITPVSKVDEEQFREWFPEDPEN